MNSRRTTLGPLSINSARPSFGGADSRKSLGLGNAFGGGPSRMSFGIEKSVSAAPRTSLGGAASRENPPPARRKSSGGGASAVGSARQSMGAQGRTSSMYARAARQDPRPITDREFMRSSIENLIKYLAEHHYDHVISMKIVKQPTAKDFNNFINFLFRCVDANYEPTGKLQDDVINMFKNIGYPFGISKTGLVAVGSPHTWPALLASMTWLIELLSYDEVVQIEGSTGLSAGDERKKAFEEYLGNAYRSFLSGDDAQFNEISAEFEASFGAKQGRDESVRREIAALEAEQVGLRAEMDRLRRAPTLAAKRAKLDDYKSDLEKFVRIVARNNQIKSALSRKLADRAADVAKVEDELARTLEESDRLNDRVARQELSAADVLKMRQMQARTADGLAAVRSRTEALREAIWQREAEVSAAHESLVGRAADYNKELLALKLWPSSAPNANGAELELRVRPRDGSAAAAAVAAAAETGDDEAAAQAAIAAHFGDDLLMVAGRSGKLASASARAALAQIREGVSEAMVSLATATAEANEEEEAAGEALVEARRAAEETEARLRRRQEDYDREKESLESLLTERSAAAEAVELQISLQRQRRASSVDVVGETRRMEAAAARAEQQTAAARAAFEARRAEISAACLSSLDVLTAHKEHLQDLIASVAAHADARRAEIAAVGPETLMATPAAAMPN